MSEIILAEYKNIHFIYKEMAGKPFFTTNSQLSTLIHAIPELAIFYHNSNGELDISLLNPNSIASKKALALMVKILEEELLKMENSNE